MFTSWIDFTESVREYLTVDGVRKGSLTQKYIERLCRAGVLDLQSFIPSLKPHRKVEFLSGDLSGEKEYGADVASGDFAASASHILSVHVEGPSGLPRSLEITHGSYSKSLPTKGHNKFGCGSISFKSCGFTVRPALKENQKLVIRYTTEVSSFLPQDKVPFDERCVKLVGEFVKAHLSREVDKDLNLYNSYMQGYLREKSMYYLDRQDYLPDCLNDETPAKYDSEEMSLESKKIKAAENLFAGDLITLTESGVQRASSLLLTTSCDGFVKSDHASGTDALVYFEGIVPGSSLEPGARYFLTGSKGSKGTESPSSGISQYIGTALSSNEINFEPDQPIQL
jgi:hypothetical protein